MRFRIKKQIIFFAVTVVIYSSPCGAQMGLLPEGVGFVNYTRRTYFTQTDQYGDSVGSRVGLGHKFDTTFSGHNMVSGASGAELKKLGQILQKYDEGSADGVRLLDTINLGNLRGRVTADVNADIYSFAYGISSHWTGFLAIPRIDMATRTELAFHRDQSGSAMAIRDALGDFAFQDLQDGLQRAANMSVTEIRQNISELGYKSPDEWSDTAFGDLRVGMQTASGAFQPEEAGFAGFYRSLVILPTGQVDDADALTDIPTSPGYYGLNFNTTQVLKRTDGTWISGSLEYQYNFPATVTRRVPEFEERSVDPARKRDVLLTPGADVELTAAAGFQGSLWQGSVRFADKRHFTDRYSSELAGNYTLLGDESDTRLVYANASVGVTTTKLYLRGQFPYPMMIDVAYNQPVTGIHAIDDRFYSISLTGFFSTRRSAANSSPQPIKKQTKAFSAPFRR
jgi:hypothetical protein